MGCVASKIDNEERVQRCKERKRLMKQLVGSREQFAAALLAYLQSLKNTGITLRQFTEAETLEPEDAPFGFALRRSPPPPLPPSPPPPPSFGPDLRKVANGEEEEAVQEESIDIDEDSSCTFGTDLSKDAQVKEEEAVQEESTDIDDDSSCPTPRPPPIPYFLDPCDPSSSFRLQQKSAAFRREEEEEWAETKTEFDEEGEVVTADIVLNSLSDKPPVAELIDDCSSMVSWNTKDTVDMATVISRSKKTLAGVVRELDDYFLKAYDGGKEVAVLLDINIGDSSHQNTGDSNSNYHL